MARRTLDNVAVNHRFYAKAITSDRRWLGVMAGVVAGLINTFNVRATTLPSVNWVSDSYSSFDVVLSGTGLGWSGTVTSPSGLWQLQSYNVLDLEGAGGSSPLVYVDNLGAATFEGQLPSGFPAPDPSADPPFNAATIATFGGYWDAFNLGMPINDKNSLICGYLNEYGDWSGLSTISVTSMPNSCDPSTWTWVAQYYASGDGLAVPEPGTLSLCGLGVLIGMVRLIQRSKSPGLAHDGRGAGGGTRP